MDAELLDYLLLDDEAGYKKIDEKYGEQIDETIRDGKHISQITDILIQHGAPSFQIESGRNALDQVVRNYLELGTKKGKYIAVGSYYKIAGERNLHFAHREIGISYSYRRTLPLLELIEVFTENKVLDSKNILLDCENIVID